MIYTRFFSDLERENVEFIYQYEQKMLSGQIPQKTTVAGKYPEASLRHLKINDFKGKSKSELRLMRNEMFARHGYIFSTEDIQNYFEKQSWYHGNITDGDEVYMKRFSDIERRNIHFIKLFEKMM